MKTEYTKILIVCDLTDPVCGTNVTFVAQHATSNSKPVNKEKDLDVIYRSYKREADVLAEIMYCCIKL